MRYGKKVHNLQLKQETSNYVDERKRSYIKHTLHHFSCYLLSNKKYTVLSIEVEFEQFYEDTYTRNVTHTPDNELTWLKTKQKYSNINVPYNCNR